MDSDPVVVVPMRSPGTGKTRLAPDLDPDTRARLAGAMLADVLHAVQGAGLSVAVAAGGPAAAAAASALRATVVMDPPITRSLDDAVAHAHRVLAPRAGLLVLQADLPLLTPEDVLAVVGARGEVVVAPTDDGGTSALLRRPPTIMGTAFGADSARAHQALARRAGVTPALVTRPGLALDVDVVGDLRRLAGRPVGPATARVLDGLDLDAAGCA